MPIVRIAGKLVYFAHVPKCAGTSVEVYLSDRFGELGFLDWRYLELAPEQRWTRSSPQHVDVASLHRLMPAEFFEACFAVVRHPVDRLVSVFRYQRDAETEIPQATEFSDWLDGLAGTGAFYLDNHARPMIDFIPEGAEIFRIEDGLQRLVDWVDALAGTDDAAHCIAVHNTFAERLTFRNRQAGDEIVPTEADRARIYEIYTEDFERFGYALDPSA